MNCYARRIGHLWELLTEDYCPGKVGEVPRADPVLQVLLQMSMMARRKNSFQMCREKIMGLQEAKYLTHHESTGGEPINYPSFYFVTLYIPRDEENITSLFSSIALVFNSYSFLRWGE